MLLYGSGLRLSECLELRVQEIDFHYKQITVRNAKGEKDRVTLQPESVVESFKRHLDFVKKLHEKDPIKVSYGEIEIGRKISAFGGKWNK